MNNGLDIHYSKKISGSGLKPISNKKTSFWIKTNFKRKRM